jgi:hypothetical protein
VIRRLAPAPGENRLRRLVESPLGALLDRPWFDRFALWSLLRWYFPLSRLWAAALAGELDLPASLLADLRRARATADAAEGSWREAVFGTKRVSPSVLAARERARRAASHALMAKRTRFVPWLREARPIRWEVPTPEAALAFYAGALPSRSALFASPSSSASGRFSSTFVAAGQRIGWLEFRSPDLGDRVTARIVEPDQGGVGTVVLGHGLMVEGELWRGSIGTAEALAGAGLRAVELTSPWHGRRALPGWYGGEPFLGTAPLGPLRLFAAQARETALVTAWCRERFGGPVGLAGVSMGSFVAQLVASHAGAWPGASRPDAILLITHHGDLGGVLRESALARGIGIHRALAAAGWSEAALVPWIALANPTASPGIPSDTIVSVLARRDVITPFAGGRVLAEAWSLPDDNRFEFPHGHFTAALSTGREPAPVARFRAILGRISTR